MSEQEEEVVIRSLKSKSTYNALRRKTVKKNSTFLNRLVVAVPPLVAETCAHLEANGLIEEGLFRVTGTMKDILALKERYLLQNESHIDLSQFSLHTVGGLLSAFLMDLDPPLLTFELYDVFIAVTGLEPQKLQLDCLKVILNTLPPGNHSVLHCIMNLYYKISQNKKKNKMSPHNVAIAVAPLLIRPELETIETMVEHGHAVQTLICTLIEQTPILFSPKQLSRRNKTIDLPQGAPSAFAKIFVEAKNQLQSALQKYNLTGERVIGVYGDGIDLPQLPDSLAIPKEEESIAKFQALWRGYALRKKLKNVNKEYQIIYNSSIWDLMKREINFLWTMNKNIADVESRLLKPNKFSKIQFENANLAKSQVHNIISNIKAVMEVHEMILEDVTDFYDKHFPVLCDIGNVLLAKTKLFIVYRTYVDMHCHFQRQIATSTDTSLLSDLGLMLDSTSSAYGSRCLKDVITLAFKHISAWKIPLQGLLDSSLTHNVNKEDTYNIMKTYAIMTRIGRFFHLLQDWKEREQVRYFDERIIDVPFCLSNNIYRRFLLEGPASISSQTRYVFLFNDLLILTKATKKSKNASTFKYKENINMVGSTVVSNKNNVAVTSEGKNFVISPKSNEDKEEWLDKFQCAASKWKGSLFGVPLRWILKREEQAEEIGIPRIVNEILSVLGETKLDEAILCASDDTFSVSVVRNSLQEGDKLINWKEHSNETLVGVLKLFCKELPEPLMEWKFCTEFPLFIDENKEDKQGFFEMLMALPPPNRNCLLAIISFLKKSKVDPVLLAMNWGHHLLRLSNETLDTANDIQFGVNVVKELITHYRRYSKAPTKDITCRRRQDSPNKEFERGKTFLKIDRK